MKNIFFILLTLQVLSKGPKKEDTAEYTEEGYESVVNKIMIFAAALKSEREPQQQRQIKNGFLPDYFPEKARVEAKKINDKKKAEGKLTKYIVDPFRFCIFPQSVMNSMRFCDEAYQKIKPNGAQKCKQMMCINCCNHLGHQLRFIAMSSKVGITVGVQNDFGYKKVGDIISDGMINECRQACHDEYPTQDKKIEKEPEKDPDLGTSEKNPGLSCIDILQNGGEKASGLYWVKQGEKPAFQVYCDQDTDDGGWTLFFAYSHRLGSPVHMNETIPLDPYEGAHHLYVKQMGFTQADCLELSNQNPDAQFIHFSTTSVDLVKQAFTGDQKSSEESYGRDYKDLEFPKNPEVKDPQFQAIAKKNVQAFPYKQTNKVSVIKEGEKTKGGFHKSPFANSDGAWSVNLENDQYYCGKKTSPAQQLGSLHQIWFRGQAPTKEYLFARQEAKRLAALADDDEDDD